MNELSLSRMIATILALDPGGRARLRRGAPIAELFLVPRLGALLSEVQGASLGTAVTTARIAAILGEDRSEHPGAALAQTGLHERRMSRLLVSDAEVLPGRLEIVARFLAAKRQPCRIRPFHWFLHEAVAGSETKERTQWARRFGETAEELKRGRKN
jgi:hypothetical protein